MANARVNLISVLPVETKNKLSDPIQLQITFEAYEDLPEEIEWELSMAWDGERTHDQILDSVEVGPIAAGKHQFTFDASNLPDYSKVKDEDVADVAVLFLRCSYRGNVFTTVSFFVSHIYTDEALINDPPAKPDFTKLERTIHTDDVRVTTFQIKWFDTDNLMPPEEENQTEEELNGEENLANDDFVFIPKIAPKSDADVLSEVNNVSEAMAEKATVNEEGDAKAADASQETSVKSGNMAADTAF